MSDSAFGRIDGSPQLRALYERLLAELDGLGPYQVQHRKALVQMVSGTAFLGVSPTEDGLRLTVVVPGEANAVQEVGSADDIDEALQIRLAAAYRAAGPPD